MDLFRGKVAYPDRIGAMKEKIPEFRNEAEEFEFWSKADSTEYVDWSKAERVKLPNLKPTLRTISLRLPVSMVQDLKMPT